MNKRQKLVQQQFLDNEDVVIKRLKQVYTQASKDINQNIADLMARNDADSSSVVYQVEYQKAIQKQINGILDTMNAQQFTTVSDYLQLCYEDGFVGTMFDLQGQGVPFVLPIDQEQIVRAVQLDSKISGGMYASFGEDTKKLKKHITAQVSRGISTGMSYEQVAQQISLKMMGTKYRPGGAYAHALNIARTEGHRIQCQSSFDALYKARNKGADIVKQWDSTLDGVTRPSHREVDGEIKELDEPFSNGLLFPGDPSGAAEEVCNCRCALLQRARWGLDNDFAKMDNESGELVKIKATDYDDFKKKYFEEVQKIKATRPPSSNDREQFERYKKVLGRNSPKMLEEFNKIKYNDPEKWDELKYQYRTINRYEVNGSVSVDKIIELDNAAYYTKKKGFDYSDFSGKEKHRIINDISNSGNVATMELDGKVYFSHSKFDVPGSFEHSLYKGEYQAVALSDNRIFKVKDLGDNIPREYDTEAKFLEFVAKQKNPTDEFTLTILSEKHICESCQGVVGQFKAMFPKATINIVSGKKGYNGNPEGLHTWKRRKRVK